MPFAGLELLFFKLLSAGLGIIVLGVIIGAIVWAGVHSVNTRANEIKEEEEKWATERSSSRRS
jgi:hypothetical protein